MTTISQEINDVRRESRLDLRYKLILLAGQAFSFGLSLSFIIIAGSALFLSRFGSKGLPYSYLAVALAGAILSSRLAVLLRRWPLPRVTLVSLAAVTVILLTTWVSMRWLGADWLAFILPVLFAIFLQVGFVFVGGQAGKLLNVREIKRYFPRIVSGFAIGFMVGGLAAPPLLTLLGQTEQLLLAAIGSTLTMLALTVMTTMRYGGILNQLTTEDVNQPRLPLRQLLTRRYVILIFLYQFLSAAGTQLVDFMLFDRTAARYATSEEIARFFGNFTAILNLTDILFLALIAGLLLSVFGLRFGLAANPAGVGILIVAVLFVGILTGPESTPFFFLIGAARIVDIMLTDGTTRTSLNAAYQALKPDDRLAVQASVEGIGVPLALGLTGVLLLIFFAIPSLTINHLVGLTLLVVVGWTALGFMVYKDYGHNLRQTLRQRQLTDLSDMALDDDEAVAAVERLLHSQRLRDIALGLDLLEQERPQLVEAHLLRLLTVPDERLQLEAVRRLETRPLQEAVPHLRQLAHASPDPALRGAAIRSLAAAQGPAAVPELAPHINDANDQVQLGASVGLMRYGSVPGVLAVGEQLTRWQSSAQAEERILAARLIGAVGILQFYLPLEPLLKDSEPAVREAALLSVAQVPHPVLLPSVVEAVDDGRIRTAALTALEAFGPDLIPVVKGELERPAPYPHPVRLKHLIQVCGQLRLPAVTQLLAAHLQHPDLHTRWHVLRALRAAAFKAEPAFYPQLNSALKHNESAAASVLAAALNLGPEPAYQPLRDALDDALVQMRQIAFILLGFEYDAQALRQAEEWLTAATESAQALAIEMLDVTLTNEQKRLLLPLAQPGLTQAERFANLSGDLQRPRLTPQAQLKQIITEPEQLWWQSAWLRSCAIYAAGALRMTELIDVITPLTADPDPTVRETVAWALHQLDPDGMAAVADHLQHDADAEV